MNHVPKERLITDAELAKWLMVSKSTLHKLRESGDLPFRQIGSCIRYSTAEIEVWLDEQGINTHRSGGNADDESENVCNQGDE